MRGLAMATCVAAGLAASWGCARAQLAANPLIGPVCRRADVVDFVQHAFQRRIIYAQMRLDSIAEAPTSLGDVVRCDVCLDVPVYDTARYGAAPAVRACEPHAYEVQNIRGGFVVRSID